MIGADRFVPLSTSVLLLSTPTSQLHGAFHSAQQHQYPIIKMSAQDTTARIRGTVARQLRNDYPYMKSATLQKMLDTMTAQLYRQIDEQ